MGDKPVDEVPGIGEVIGDNMREDGIHLAKDLYKIYKRRPNTFRDKVMTYGANAGQQDAAYFAMRDYDDQHG